jgi:DNA-binding MarR family transcriptional regulator
LASKDGARTATAEDRRFIYLLNIAQRRLQQWTISEETGLTSAQAGALFQLDHERGVLIGDVARTLGMGPSGISGLVDRMEAAGLVTRVPDSLDGRAVRLVLTEGGQAARTVAKRLAGVINARLIEGFTSDELDVVARWLNHVTESFKRKPEE